LEVFIVESNLYSLSLIALEQIYMNAVNKKIQINNMISKEIICSIDENMIITVFRNLVSNAIKFTNESGVINLNSYENIERKEVVISIEDNGIGMSDEILGKLFKIDTVIKQRGTNNETGTGLGLILCKEFVEINKGRIWAESKEGIGSTFYFTIPLAS